MPRWARPRTARSRASRSRPSPTTATRDAAADPSKFPAGLFNVITGSYDFDNAFVEVDGVYTNKPPGGVAYRCSFRVTEAVHAIERMVDILAHEIGKDPAQLRMENFIQPEQFPYKTPTGWEYDSGNYAAGAPDGHGHDRLRRAAQGAAREARPRRAHGHRHQQLHRDRRGRAVARLRHPRAQDERRRARSGSTRPARSSPGSASQTQGQGHETTYAQIIAEELGLPGRRTSRSSTATPTRRRTASGPTAPRSTPTSPARPPSMASRKILAKARTLAAHLLEATEEDLEWEPGKFSVKGSPDRFKTIQEIAFAAYTNYPAGDGDGPRGGRLLRPAEPDLPVRQLHLRRRHRQGHGAGPRPPLRRRRRLRQHHQPDDRGRPDPRRPEHGPRPGAVRADHLRRARQQPGRHVHGLPASRPRSRSPAWEIGKTITPSPHHPIGAKGVGESATVGAPPAIANAVVDALWHLGVRNIDIPITPQKVWAILHENGHQLGRR